MIKSFHFLLAAGALALASCSCMNAQTSVASGQPDFLKPQQLSQTFRTDYLLFLPKDYDNSPGKRWPLILFLHGSGERGTNVWRTAIHGPTKYIANHPDFPFIFISPQCPENQKWSDDTVLGVLDSVISKYSVDTNRIYLTGLSMGGYGTWGLATLHPERFAAIAPICGGDSRIGIVLTGLDKSRAPLLKTLPVWAFHGGKDTTVLLEESERMIKILKDLGNKDVKLTIYPEAQHDSWTATYNNPELYDWFLKHSLNGETAN
jgi:predicted peptidase